jgi:bifunctional UDP-N-acetylglucosamine pyrophosphorylase / glucosamine-1-phosphate N-acetyltransferase
MMKNFTTIVLAGGMGTRMKSPLPKVLHPVAGLPMIFRIVSECKKAGAENIRVVLGHGSSLVQQVIEPLGVQIFQQKEQLGTADAVKAAEVNSIEGLVVIVNGDHPLLTSEDLHSCINSFDKNNLDLAVVSVNLKSPNQFGRIVRSQGVLKSIVEAKDANLEILKIEEINTGIYITHARHLAALLPKIKNENSKSEFYLTDIVELALGAQLKVDALISENENLAHGVNSQSELAGATQKAFSRKAEKVMNEGVILLNPATTYIEDTVLIGAGAVIYPGVFLRGKTAIGPYSVIEPNVFVSDSIIEDGVQVKLGSHLERVVVKSKAQIGPYARLRPDTVIGASAKVGNFVEMKKVNFGAGSKASHLSYLGDADVGVDVNIGCGTITCNYAADEKKYKTIIKDRVFVGSDSQLVAPVIIHEDSIIASGSTITKDVPAGALAIARGRQENKDGMAHKFKKNKN